MLAKKNRFHGNGAIMHVMRRGQAYRTGGLQIRVFTKRDGAFRAAVVVSKKVDKKAVTRNRIRRRVFAALKNQLNTSQLTADIIISVFDVRFSDKPAADLNKDIEALLKKAQLPVNMA